MSPRKELHDWMLSNYFKQCDIKKINALYLVTFGEEFSKPLKNLSVNAGITYNQFRSKMASLGLIELTNSEIEQKEKELFEAAGKELDRLYVRQFTDVPYLRLEHDCATGSFSFKLDEPISQEMIDLFSGKSKPYQPKEGDIVKFTGEITKKPHIIVYRNEKIKDCFHSGYGGFNIIDKWNISKVPIGHTTEPLSPVTEEERKQFHTELSKLGKWLNPETHLIEDDTRIDIDKIDLANCIAKKDLTPYFPTKELQYMAINHNDNLCGLKCLFNKNTLYYVQGGIMCYKIKCSDCPFNSDNRNLMLSMKPFAKELTDKEKFEQWRKEKGYSSLVNLTIRQEKLSKKLYAIQELCLCAKYLNKSECSEGYWMVSYEGNIRVSYTSVNAKDPADSFIVLFKTKDIAEKAISILGEDLIKQALSNDY